MDPNWIVAIATTLLAVLAVATLAYQVGKDVGEGKRPKR
jgi:hypothetical protein